MSIFYHFPPKRPRTIESLEISDCVEIIVNDLARYGVPEQLAMKLIMTHFERLNKVANELKKTYGKVTLKDFTETGYSD